MIEIKNVSKKFNDFMAVNDITFKANDGEILGLIGPNGSGKSTTLKMLSGILKPSSGNINVCGYDILTNPVNAKENIGYISDSPDMMLRLKGIEFLNFIADIYKIDKNTRMKKIEDLSKQFEIYDSLSNPMLSYSHGMRQKIMVVGALLHDPEVFILDEPLTGLDPKSAYILKNMMLEHKKKNKTVIFSTHVLEVAEKICDRIVIIFKGTKLYEGTIEDLKNKYPNESLEEIYINITNENN